MHLLRSYSWYDTNSLFYFASLRLRVKEKRDESNAIDCQTRDGNGF